MRIVKTKVEKSLLADAVGNLYRAAFFLARSAQGKDLAEKILDKTEAIFADAGLASQKIKKITFLKKRLKMIADEKDRLILAERILDEYQKLVQKL